MVYNNTLQLTRCQRTNIGETMGADAGHIPAVRDEAVIASVRRTTEAIAASQRGDHKGAANAMQEIHQQRAGGSDS